MNFDSQEAAVAFAEKLGYQTVVRDPNTRRPDRLKRFAGYGDNFRLATSAPFAPPLMAVSRKKHPLSSPDSWLHLLLHLYSTAI